MQLHSACFELEVSGEPDQGLLNPALITDMLKALEAELRPSVNKRCSVFFATAPHMQELNLTYRAKDYPTNVLSFTSELPMEVQDQLIESTGFAELGELVVCMDVVIKEALEQQKKAAEHLCHMLLHGLLHLMGYDHETSEKDAQIMESLEINILSKLGVANPYAYQPS